MSATPANTKKRFEETKSENNRRRLQRILRSMMRDGLDLSTQRTLGAGGFGQLPYRRVIE